MLEKNTKRSTTSVDAAILIRKIVTVYGQNGDTKTVWSTQCCIYWWYLPVKWIVIAF